ncbi:MAG: AraC family transcriptional regulator [Hyphomicrobiaceae bacterium]
MSTMLELAQRIKSKYGVPGCGMKATSIAGVHFYSVDEPIERTPLIYHSGIIIIISGRKVGHLGGRAYNYDSEHYLTLGLPLAFECETHASKEAPVFGLFIEVNSSIVTEVALAMGLNTTNVEMDVLAVEAAPMGAEMSDAVRRLLAHLCSDVDSAVLGDGCVREIIYRALQGPAGSALKGLLRQDGHTVAVAKVMQDVHLDCAKHRSIEDMAKMVGMSTSNFHRAFRQVTNDTPLQYIKKVRLSQARDLIVQEGSRVGSAAIAVGYESPAQFSRDFRSYFGFSPVEAKRNGYLLGPST